MAARLPMIVTDVGGNPEAVFRRRNRSGSSRLTTPQALGQAFFALLTMPALRDPSRRGGQQGASNKSSRSNAAWTPINALYEETPGSSAVNLSDAGRTAATRLQETTTNRTEGRL